MKKLIRFLFASALLAYFSGCTGYVPIYKSSNFNFKIEDYSLKGEERLSNLIYNKINYISLGNKNNPSVQSINISIETNKEKKSTVKNSAGKILEYEISLSTIIIISDYLTEKTILNQTFNYSISYKVQDEHSETLKLENKNIENLVEKTYQDALIKISEIVKSE